MRQASGEEEKAGSTTTTTAGVTLDDDEDTRGERFERKKERKKWMTRYEPWTMSWTLVSSDPKAFAARHE